MRIMASMTPLSCNKRKTLLIFKHLRECTQCSDSFLVASAWLHQSGFFLDFFFTIINSLRDGRRSTRRAQYRTDRQRCALLALGPRQNYYRISDDVNYCPAFNLVRLDLLQSRQRKNCIVRSNMQRKCVEAFLCFQNF